MHLTVVNYRSILVVNVRRLLACPSRVHEKKINWLVKGIYHSQNGQQIRASIEAHWQKKKSMFEIYFFH